jgi:hypothetical protein
MSNAPQPWAATAPPPWAATDGLCVVCRLPTDTGIAFRGTAGWLLDGLITLGVPDHEAYTTYWHEQNRAGRSLPYGALWPGVRDLMARVCADCVRKCPVRIPPPALVMHGTGLPTIEMPGLEDADESS